MAEIKQYIVVRRDAQTKTGKPVSPAKLAVMVAHASMAFLTNRIKGNVFRRVYAHKDGVWQAMFLLDEDSMDWINGIFAKVLLEAKTLHSLERVVEDAKAMGLEEGVDFVKIEDNCLTELVPDEGSTRCFIAVGFKPMDVEKIKPIVKRLQLYK